MKLSLGTCETLEGEKVARLRFQSASRTPCPGSYLLLRPGETLLDVDGQFSGGDPFPCLGHVARCGGLLGSCQDR